MLDEFSGIKILHRILVIWLCTSQMLCTCTSSFAIFFITRIEVLWSVNPKLCKRASNMKPPFIETQNCLQKRTLFVLKYQI